MGNECGGSQTGKLCLDWSALVIMKADLKDKPQPVSPHPINQSVLT